MASLAPAALRQRPWLFPALVALCAALALWSFLGAGDKPTWAFEVLPLSKVAEGFWWTLGVMALIALVLALVFRHKRYLARGGR